MHLSTVHPRRDTRIYVKELASIRGLIGARVGLVVADGKGDEREESKPTVLDIGPLPASRLARALAGSWRALRMMRYLNPRLVHFHDPELLPLALVLTLLGYRVVYDVHEDVPRQVMAKYWIPAAFRWVVAR
ncbi:MAG: glycosyltransferase, partial [Burkholderiaceae bacterium]